MAFRRASLHRLREVVEILLVVVSRFIAAVVVGFFVVFVVVMVVSSVGSSKIHGQLKTTEPQKLFGKNLVNIYERFVASK
jgi:hypothetical protein